MSGVDNMEYMYSLNQNSGLSSLTVDFDVKTDPNIDLILAQMRESQAASQLPAEVNAQGVIVQKSTAAPLMLFDLYAPDGRYDAQFLANYAYINLNDNLHPLLRDCQRIGFRCRPVRHAFLGRSGPTGQAADHGA